MFIRTPHEAFTPEEQKLIAEHLEAEMDGAAEMIRTLHDDDAAGWKQACTERINAVYALDTIFRTACERGRSGRDERVAEMLSRAPHPAKNAHLN